MGISCIYKITNSVNGKVYVGQTVNYKKRSKSHFSKLTSKKHHNLYLQQSFDKYKKSSFSIEIIEECDVDMLDELEMMYINKYKSTDKKFGYNLVKGGQRYRFFTDDVKKRMSEAGKGRIFSIEHRENISKSQKGKVIPRESIEKANKTKKERMSNVGEKNHKSLFSDEIAKLVIIDLLNNREVKDITQKYGASADSVYNIMYNKSFKHIMPEIRDSLAKRVNINNENRIEKAIEMYVNGKSQNEIASELNISRNTIRRELKKRDIDTQLHKNQFVSTLIPR